MIDMHYLIHNKIKNRKYHTVSTFPKSNTKIAERGKIDTSSPCMTSHLNMNADQNLHVYKLYP
jgi:hypothetical protein